MRLQVVREAGKAEAMWNFGQKAGPMVLSEKLALHLARERGLSRDAAAALRMVQEHGHYVGRSVTYFRIFDPAATKAAGIELRGYKDLDARTIIHAGHIESDGQVVLNLKPSED
ncbi:MAG: hypothetical protein HY677_05165 [Chloroflexi bacterium]|nr:hypothetical protein [Chloroflexota bacterium]